MSAQAIFRDCTVMRRMLITNNTLDLATGKTSEVSQEWVTRACGTPLFGDEERKSGKCRSCASGWTHEHNYPVQS